MARLSKTGQYIISAAEVGTYTVCPESWRLRTIENLDSDDHSQNIKIGNKLHDKWAKQNAEAIFFKRGINILLLLIAHAIVLSIYVMKYE